MELIVHYLCYFGQKRNGVVVAYYPSSLTLPNTGLKATQISLGLHFVLLVRLGILGLKCSAIAVAPPVEGVTYMTPL